MPDADDFGFTLIPADDDPLAPAEAVEAAVASALEETPPEEEPPPPQPFGRSWSFDFDAERPRFRRHGYAPAEVRGHDALKQWVQMAARTARFAHASVSDEFGMERLEDVIGEVDVDEMAADYADRFRQAILVHERIVAVDNLDPVYDSTTGVLDLGNFDIVTDEDERVSFRNVLIPTVE